MEKKIEQFLHRHTLALFKTEEIEQQTENFEQPFQLYSPPTL
jgi:hypothetical protein